MADAKLSATVPHAHVSSSGEPGSAHPLAGPGYGKRSAPGQLRRTAHDFAGLPAREAAIAGYLDRLPDGSDISVKTLAKVLPYGQCALGTALNRLQKAGYLRRGREVLVNAEGGSRWITRSWFSRTARDDDWWAAFTRGDLPEDGIPEEGVPEEGIPPVVRRARRSRAHLLLAALGRTTPALSLSEADCAALAPLLTEWFERGASDEAVLNALTSGLPVPVHHPAGLVRRRLTSKLPPEPPPEPAPVSRPPRPPMRVLECANCRAPGRPESLPGGLCGDCRGERAPRRYDSSEHLKADTVRSHAAGIRAAMSRRREQETHV